MVSTISKPLSSYPPSHSRSPAGAIAFLMLFKFWPCLCHLLATVCSGLMVSHGDSWSPCFSSGSPSNHAPDCWQSSDSNTSYCIYITPKLQALFWAPRVFRSKLKLLSNAHGTFHYLAHTWVCLLPSPPPLPQLHSLLQPYSLSICCSPNIQAALGLHPFSTCCLPRKPILPYSPSPILYHAHTPLGPAQSKLHFRLHLLQKTFSVLLLIRAPASLSCDHLPAACTMPQTPMVQNQLLFNWKQGMVHLRYLQINAAQNKEEYWHRNEWHKSLAVVS